MSFQGMKSSSGLIGRGSNRGVVPTAQQRNSESQDRSDSAVDLTVDPFLLDFGTSVNVNEDLRRTIRGEIQEIEESITTVSAENKKEEMAERQLRQDLYHSHSELTDLCRCTTDQLENVQVHATFLQGLENTLHIDLVTPSGLRAPGTVAPTASKTAGKNGATNASATENGQESYKEIIERQESKLQKITASMKSTAEEVDELFQKQQNTMKATKAIENRIKSENLNAVLKAKEDEGDQLDAELQQEKDKLQAIKLATHKMRTNIGDNAQQMADLTKEEDSQRRQADAEKAELDSQLSTLDELEKKEEEEIRALNEKILEVKAALQEVADQKKLSEDHAEAQAELEKEQKRNAELARQMAEYSAKLEASSAQLEASREEVAKAQDLNAQALKLKAQNDEKHNNIRVPGRVELAEIAEQKENLAKVIEETQKNNDELELSKKDQLVAKLDKKRLALEELDGLEDEINALKAAKSAMDIENQQTIENWEREIQEHLDLEVKLRGAVETKEAQLKEKRREEANRHQEKIDQATKRVEEQKAKGDRLLHILRSGSDLMVKFQQKMDKLGQKAEF